MTEALQQEIRTLRSLHNSERDPEGRVFAPLADAYRRAGQIPEAVRLLNEGLARHPDFVTGHVVAAQLYVEQGLAEEAGFAARKALELDPDNVNALRSLLRVLEEKGEGGEAAEVRSHLVSLDPEYARPAPRRDAPPESDTAPLSVLSEAGAADTLVPDADGGSSPEAADTVAGLSLTDADLGAGVDSLDDLSESDGSLGGDLPLPSDETAWGEGTLTLAEESPDEDVESPTDEPVFDLDALTPPASAGFAELAVEEPAAPAAPDLEGLSPDPEPIFELDAMPAGEERAAEEADVLDIGLLSADEPEAVEIDPASLPEPEPVLDLGALAPEEVEEEAVLDMAALAPEEAEDDAVLDMAALAPEEAEEEAVLDMAALAPEEAEDDDVLDMAALAPEEAEEEEVLDMAALAPEEAEEEEVLDMAALAPEEAEDDAVLDMAALAPEEAEDDAVLDMAALAPEEAEDEEVFDLDALAPDPGTDPEDEAVDITFLAPAEPDEIIIDMDALRPDAVEPEQTPTEISMSGPTEEGPREEEEVTESVAEEAAVAGDDPGDELEDAGEPVYTRTLAELYVKQGAVDRALRVLKHLHAADPSNQDLADRIEQLESGEDVEAEMPVAPVAAPRIPRPEATVEPEPDAELEELARDLASSGEAEHEVDSPFAWAEKEGVPDAPDGPSIRDYFDGLLTWEPGDEP